MPTHFQRSENDIYPHNPPTSPQTLAWCLWHHRSLRKSLSPAPPPPKADRGSDSVRGQGVHMLKCKTVGKASALGKRTSRSEAVRLVPLRLFTSGSVSERTTYLHHDRPLQTNLHKCLVFLVHLLNKILHILGKSFFLLAVHAGDIDWLAKFKDSVSLFKEWKVVF